MGAFRGVRVRRGSGATCCTAIRRTCASTAARRSARGPAPATPSGSRHWSTIRYAMPLARHFHPDGIGHVSFRSTTPTSAKSARPTTTPPSVVGYRSSVPCVLGRSTFGSAHAPTSLARSDRPARAWPPCPGNRRDPRHPPQSGQEQHHGPSTSHRTVERSIAAGIHPAPIAHRQSTELQPASLHEEG